jgi:hypothetical protein
MRWFQPWRTNGHSPLFRQVNLVGNFVLLAGLNPHTVDYDSKSKTVKGKNGPAEMSTMVDNASSTDRRLSALVHSRP